MITIILPYCSSVASVAFAIGIAIGIAICISIDIEIGIGKIFFSFCRFLCLLPDSIEPRHSWQREVVLGSLCGVRSGWLEGPKRFQLLESVRVGSMLQ